MNREDTYLSETVELFLYYRQSKGILKNTYLQNETIINNFISWCDENGYTKPKHLNSLKLYEYINFLYNRNLLTAKKEKKLSRTSIIAHVKVLKLYFQFMEKECFCPDFGKDISRPKEPYQIIEAFSDEQIRLIFQHIHQEKYRVLFYLLLTTGLRISEALSLKLENFYFDRRLIRITGKGNKQREVPYPKNLEEKILNFAKGKKSDEYLWPGRNVGQLSTAAVRNELYRIKKEVGNQADLNRVQVRPHVFRHTFAKNWIMNQGDVLSLQRILGHKKLDMTMRYVHMWGDDLVKKYDFHAPRYDL